MPYSDLCPTPCHETTHIHKVSLIDSPFKFRVFYFSSDKHINYLSIFSNKTSISSKWKKRNENKGTSWQCLLLTQFNDVWVWCIKRDNESAPTKARTLDLTAHFREQDPVLCVFFYSSRVRYIPFQNYLHTERKNKVEKREEKKLFHSENLLGSTRPFKLLLLFFFCVRVSSVMLSK